MNMPLPNAGVASAASVLAPYDPRYDPLVDSAIREAVTLWRE